MIKPYEKFAKNISKALNNNLNESLKLKCEESKKISSLSPFNKTQFAEMDKKNFLEKLNIIANVKNNNINNGLDNHTKHQSPTNNNCNLLKDKISNEQDNLPITEPITNTTFYLTFGKNLMSDQNTNSSKQLKNVNLINPNYPEITSFDSNASIVGSNIIQDPKNIESKFNNEKNKENIEQEIPVLEAPEVEIKNQSHTDNMISAINNNTNNNNINKQIIVEENQNSSNIEFIKNVSIDLPTDNKLLSNSVKIESEDKDNTAIIAQVEKKRLIIIKEQYFNSNRKQIKKK